MGMASIQDLTPSLTPSGSSFNADSGCSGMDMNMHKEDPTLAVPSSKETPMNVSSTNNTPTIRVDGTAEEKALRGDEDNEEDEDKAKVRAAKRLTIDDVAGETKSSALFYESVGGIHAPELAKRRAKADMRLMQSKAYAELLEDRIFDLEDKVRKLRGEPKPADIEDDVIGDVPTITEIGMLGWTEFSRRIEINRKDIPEEWKHCPEVDQEPRHVIEILKEEPRFDFFKLNTQSSNAAQSRPDVAGIQVHDSSVDPHRIRIRSKLLLKVLKEITGCNTTLGPYEHRLLLLQPFKLLVSFEKNIRDFLRDVEELHAGKEASPLPDGSGPGPCATQPGAIETAFPPKETQSLEALQQLKLLCQVMDDYLGRQIELQKSLDHNVRKVTFNDLWYIFKPGYEVRTPGDSQIQLYRIVKVTGGRDSLLTVNSTSETPASEKLKEEGYSVGSFIIECFYIHFDGTRFGPVNATFQIRKFEGERMITSFPVVPLRCYENEGDLRQKLLVRGEKFTELSNSRATAHRKYKGLTLDKNQEQVESEVIVDFELAFLQKKDSRPNLGLEGGLVSDDQREFQDYWRFNNICDQSGCCGNDIIYGDYEVDERERGDFKDNHKALFDSGQEQLKPEQKILLPPLVYGFVLRTRRWATFDIDLLTDPAYGDGWNNLVIDGYIKDTVLALVQSHERPRDSQARIDGALSSVDLVQGKGRGLIILLHGEPGVGKTSTAECVAAHTKRPLFPITCGDIGDRADAVETNLEKNFQLAHRWGCVLLLDEADIFLSARTEEDIQRNAIVSVFLRTVEYYSGILFLTTNRVGKIDRAFKSRIHLSLLYKKLNRTRTIQIWENNIRRVQEEFANEKKPIDCRRDDIISFAKRHYKELKESDDLIVWNGRQIRNAFQTAIAIATYDAGQRSSGKDDAVPVLDSAQFERVAKSAKQFDKYLKKVSMYSDAQIAKLGEERDDEYSSSEGDSEDEKPSKKEQKKRKKRKEIQRGMSDSDSDSKSNSDSDLERRLKRRKK